MLYEIKYAKQLENEPIRRIFSDDFFDLYIWYDNSNIIGFQLCYDVKTYNEHAISWFDNNYKHLKAKKYFSGLMIKDGFLDKVSLIKRFENESKNLESNIKDFVVDKISNYTNEIDDFSNQEVKYESEFKESFSNKVFLKNEKISIIRKIFNKISIIK